MTAGAAAFEGPRIKLIPGLTTIHDLSTQQFHVVKGDTATALRVLAVADGDADVPLGILQNNPVGSASSARECEVMDEGISKVVAGDAITPYQLVGFDDTGRAIPYAGTGSYLLGMALLPANGAGEVITVDIRWGMSVHA